MGLTRHKISDGCRERAQIEVETFQSLGKVIAPRAAVRRIVWLGGGRGYMPSVLRYSKFFTSAFLRERECALQVIVRASIALKRVDVESNTRVFHDLECASAL